MYQPGFSPLLLPDNFSERREAPPLPMARSCEAGGAGWGVGQAVYDCSHSEAPTDRPCLPYNGYYQEVGAE